MAILSVDFHGTDCSNNSRLCWAGTQRKPEPAFLYASTDAFHYIRMEIHHCAQVSGRVAFGGKDVVGSDISWTHCKIV